MQKSQQIKLNSENLQKYLRTTRARVVHRHITWWKDKDPTEFLSVFNLHQLCITYVQHSHNNLHVSQAFPYVRGGKKSKANVTKVGNVICPWTIRVKHGYFLLQGRK
jgi:hypothetical protein